MIDQNNFLYFSLKREVENNIIDFSKKSIYNNSICSKLYSEHNNSNNLSHVNLSISISVNKLFIKRLKKE